MIRKTVLFDCGGSQAPHALPSLIPESVMLNAILTARKLRVPFNALDRSTHLFRSELDAALGQVLNNGLYVFGPEHNCFESEFADYCGVAHAIAVANGTDALELALRVTGCGPGDEVITVPNAGGYTTTACCLVGATPVYVDVDPDTLLMAPPSVAAAVSDKTKAVVVTHLYGRLADVASIRRALPDRGISLIEDCAQAHGASSPAGKAGSLGLLGTFSFYPTKNLGAIGDGGALVTDDPELAAALRELRQYGWSEKYHSTTPGGRNSRLDELQAAVLRVKLPHLDVMNSRRRAVAAAYAEAAAGTSLRVLNSPDAGFVAHLCVAMHPERERIQTRLAKHGIQTAVHYPVLDVHQASLNNKLWRAVSIEHALQATKEIVSLPCYPEITDEEVDHVCESIRTAA